MEGVNVAANRELWKSRVDDWKASGLSQSEWCRRNNKSVKTLGYWVRKLRTEEALSHIPKGETASGSGNEFYEVSFPSKGGHHSREESPGEQMNPELAVQFKDFLLYINHGVSQCTLRTVMEVLADA